MRTTPNLIGTKFSSWTVLGRVDQPGATFWMCRCDCGTERSVWHGNLFRGSSTNCGCIAFKNRQAGRNLAPTERDNPLPDEFWCRLIAPWNGIQVEASTCGRVRHADSGHVYAMFSENGYLKTSIGGKIAKVHRIVATTFHPNPLNLPQVNHLDGSKKNNTPDNLEWSTHRNNMRHAWETGLCRPYHGSTNPASKLTEQQVIEIRRRYIRGTVKQSDLANEYGVSQVAISLITRREKWTHV